MRGVVVVGVLVAAACGTASPPPKPIVVETAPVADAGPPQRIVESPPPSATAVTPAPPSTETCDAPCKGAVGDDLVQALSFRAKQAHRCYDNALATDPSLRGKVMVRLRIGADGKTCTAVGESPQPGMRQVADCVAAYFGGAPGTMPRPSGGCADVNLPINFLPRGDAGAP